MSDARWTIFAEEGGAWRIAGSETSRAAMEAKSQAADEGGVGGSIAKALKEEGWHTGEAVMLALPSAWCLAATIQTAGLASGNRRAMLYRLEEKLPLAAEDVVADFAAALDDKSLGVATRIATVRPLVEALEVAGVPVASICPAALLAAQGASPPDALLMARDGVDRLSVVRVQTGQLVSWSMIPANAADVRREIRLTEMTAGNTNRFALGEVPRELIAALGEPTTVVDVSSELAARRAAGQILAGLRRPWIELRRDALAASDRMRAHRKPLHALLGAVAILLLALAAAMVLRGIRYDRAARDSEAQLASEFSRAFPGWPVPVNVRAVVESEHRKRIVASDSDNAPSRAGATTPGGDSALRTLRDLLAALPADAHFSLQRMTFEDTGFELEGRTTYTDLSPLVAAARSAGFAVAPPLARREEDGAFGFTLHGTREKAPAVATGASAR